MKKKFTSLSFILLLAFFSTAFALQEGVSNVRDIENILHEKERAELMARWAEWRIENILPGMMERSGIDMWIIIDRENNIDPVSASLSGEDSRMNGVGFMILMYKDNRVEQLRGGFRNIGKLVEEYNPKTIGINTSEVWNNGDGLTAAMKSRLEKALGKYASRLVSAEDLSNEWLETKTLEQLSVYRHVCGVAHDIIAEAFSNRVIVPDVTTTNDVAWWIKQRMRDIGVSCSFFPTVVLQRSMEEREKYDDPDDDFRIDVAPRELINTTIRRGDIISVDWGIEYLGLVSDMQNVAYVCKTGEQDAPEGLKQALRNTNRLQDVFLAEFKEGRSGNDVWFDAIRKTRAEGLRPSIYTHPIGYHGHSGGPSIGSGGTPYEPLTRGEYPIHYNTVYAVELDVVSSVPEWDGQDVIICLEEEGTYTRDGSYFIDGRQTEWYIIK